MFRNPNSLPFIKLKICAKIVSLPTQSRALDRLRKIEVRTLVLTLLGKIVGTMPGSLMNVRLKQPLPGMRRLTFRRSNGEAWS
jgi:hypothetical protein